MKIAYHFLQDDMTANSGSEAAWTVDEERTWKDGKKKPKICERGYHSSPSWYDALNYAQGNVACIVEVSDPVESDNTKQVSAIRKLIAARNVERELRLWGIECAERALNRERQRGREPDKRSWTALIVARRFADGEATAEELAAARDAAWAARDAARDAEVEWQKQRLNEILDAALKAVPA